MAKRRKQPLAWCLYCDGKRPSLEPSLEHIWPEALGGESGPDIFKTRDVCARCNNLSGQWVDGAFLKSWFLQAEHAISVHDYLDPERPEPMPAVYLGIDEEFPTQDGEICERWAGPVGAHIYHVHQRDDDRWKGFAGGDFIRRRGPDPGRAYLRLTSDNEYWALASLLSFQKQFPAASRRCLTGIEPPLPDAWGILNREAPPRSTAEAAEMAFIVGQADTTRRLRMDIQVDFSDRFLAKLALGFCHTILGESASRSRYAGALRQRLWSRTETPEEADTIRGAGFWGGRDDELMANFMGWRGAWTLTFQPMPDGFGMTIIMPGGRLMAMLLSDEPSLWPEAVVEQYADGLVYVVVPARGRTVGPIPLANFVSHKLGNHRETDLVGLEALRIDRTALPPVRATMDTPQT